MEKKPPKEKESPTEKKKNSNGKMEAGVQLNNSRKGIQDSTNGLKAGALNIFFLWNGPLWESDEIHQREILSLLHLSNIFGAHKK